MFKFINFKKFTTAGIIGILLAGTFQVAPGVSVDSDGETATGSLTPDSYSEQIRVNNSVSLERNITVEIPDVVTTTTTEKPQKLDVLFLADNTGSMGTAIKNVQDNAQSLLQSLSSNYDDIQVGVARYYGDPSEYGAAGSSVRTYKTVKYTYSLAYTGETSTCRSSGYTYTCYKYDAVYDKGGDISTWTSYLSSYRHGRYGGSYTNSWNVNKAVMAKPASIAYELQQPIQDSTQAAIDSINDWSASGGGDWPEANFFALHQAATNGAAIDGYATGSNTGWRSDAKKIIVWFGDAKSHTGTINKTEVAQALADNDISVVAINSSSSDYSLANGLNADSQASTITSATGGEFASVYSSELATTMKDLIGNVAVVTTTTTTPGIVDLTFTSVGNTDGLSISYTCIDSLGCDNVKTGESRRFRMDVTGDTAGTYTFNTVAEDVDGAIASNNITVDVPAVVYAD